MRVIVRKPVIILIKKGHQIRSISDEFKRKDRKTGAQKPVKNVYDKDFQKGMIMIFLIEMKMMIVC